MQAVLKGAGHSRAEKPGHLHEAVFDPFLDFSSIFCGLWPATGFWQEHNSCCTIITTNLVYDKPHGNHLKPTAQWDHTLLENAARAPGPEIFHGGHEGIQLRVETFCNMLGGNAAPSFVKAQERE